MIRTVIIAASIAMSALGFAPAAAAGPVYDNCDDAHAAGVYDIPKGDPAYWKGGDRDDDGYACDSSDN